MINLHALFYFISIILKWTLELMAFLAVLSRYFSIEFEYCTRGKYYRKNVVLISFSRISLHLLRTTTILHWSLMPLIWKISISRSFGLDYYEIVLVIFCFDKNDVCCLKLSPCYCIRYRDHNRWRNIQDPNTYLKRRMMKERLFIQTSNTNWKFQRIDTWLIPEHDTKSFTWIFFSPDSFTVSPFSCECFQYFQKYATKYCESDKIFWESSFIFTQSKRSLSFDVIVIYRFAAEFLSQ